MRTRIKNVFRFGYNANLWCLCLWLFFVFYFSYLLHVHLMNKGVAICNRQNTVNCIIINYNLFSGFLLKVFTLVSFWFIKMHIYHFLHIFQGERTPRCYIVKTGRLSISFPIKAFHGWDKSAPYDFTKHIGTIWKVNINWELISC